MNLLNKPPMGLKQPKPVKDSAHIELVKQLPCVICNAPPPSDAHHCICGRFGGRKAGDDKVIPLCKNHHQWGPDAIHNGKESWVEKFGNDYDYLPQVKSMLEDNLLGEWF